MKWKLETLTLIQAEWNHYNGAILTVLGIGFNGDEGRALFGFNADKNFLYLYLLFINVKIFDKTDHSKF